MMKRLEFPAPLKVPDYASPEGLEARRKTMTRETTYAGMLGDVTRLITALAANAADLPHIEGTREKLEKLLAETQATVQAQSALTATKQELSKKLRAQVGEGQRLTTAIRKLLKENYGVGAEKLAEFGVQPFRGRKAKTQPPAPPPGPESPVKPSHS
jgi:hypothetical protein